MNFKELKNQYTSVIGSRTMGSLSLLLSANTLNAIIGFVTSVLVLRYVENEVIAVIYPLVSILMIVGQFGDLGISNSFIKIASSYFQKDREKSLQFFNAALALKTILGVAVLVLGIPLSGIIAHWLFDRPVYVEWTRLIILVSGLQILSSYAMAALQIEGKFGYLSTLKVIPTLLKLIMIAILVYYNIATVEWIFWAFALVPIVTFIMAFAKTNKTPIFKTRANSQQMSELFHVSKWVALSVIANSVLGQIDILMTRSLAGVDELTRLAGGQKLAGVITILSMSVVTVLLPKVASMSDKRELNFFFRKALLFVLPLAIVVVAALPLTQYVIPFILGSKYNSSIDIFNIYMLGNVIGITVTPLSLILYKLNKEPQLALMNILQLVICALGSYLLIPSYGATAAAGMFVVTKLIAMFMIYYLLWKEGILRKYDN